MAKNKRKSVLENADEKKKKNANANNSNGIGKGARTCVATLAICAAAFGAYYSPHFRTASNGWLERWRALGERSSATNDVLADASVPTSDKTGEKLAQAPSFRDFLTDEYGEEGARELLGIDSTAPSVATGANAGFGFADYVAAEESASNANDSRAVGSAFDASSVPVSPSSPEPRASFADYVAAEESASDANDSRAVGSAFDASSVPVSPSSPEPRASFADYVAAEESASDANDSRAVGSAFDASSVPVSPSSSEPRASFADYVAAKPAGDAEPNELEVSAEKTRLASAVEAVETFDSSDGETALAARLEAEMRERGVGNPRVERWGGRFWRASGFATTNGVATFCEAVDVDPTAAQRAALVKFDAANF